MTTTWSYYDGMICLHEGVIKYKVKEMDILNYKWIDNIIESTKNGCISKLAEQFNSVILISVA